MAASGMPKSAPGRQFFLVDPLDGTKEFISRNGEFTVNIALIDSGRPVLGVVHAPALGTSYWGWGAGCARVKRGTDIGSIRARPAPPGGHVVVASRSHRDARTDQWLTGVEVASLRSAGSSLKFCLLAAGEADLYPRLGRTMEWDTAAGHAVLAAAGGRVDTIDGMPLTYGKPGFENPDFVARGA